LGVGILRRGKILICVGLRLLQTGHFEGHRHPELSDKHLHFFGFLRLSLQKNGQIRPGFALCEPFTLFDHLRGNPFGKRGFDYTVFAAGQVLLTDGRQITFIQFIS